MRNLNQEIKALLEAYGTDLKRALRENKQLDYLYALAGLRENLLEWYDFNPDGELLQVGADFGALTGLFARRVRQVTVLDGSKESLDVVGLRYRGAENISLCRGSLAESGALSREGKSADAAAEQLLGNAGADAAAEQTSGNAGADAAAEQTSGNAGAGVLSGSRYDYVTLIGSLGETRKIRAAQVREAARLLVPGGKLLVAACNRFGVKYWAGAKRETGCVTGKELSELLPGGTFYYPMPDYRLPSSVYSEQYLPQKGELRGELPLYDYPRHLLTDVGEAYDAVCEDGQFGNFANSFLVIWEKGEKA